MQPVISVRYLKFPTALGAVLLQLYANEMDEDVFEPTQVVNWWMRKLQSPDVADDWLNTRLWRLYARHLHAVIAENAPELANQAAACFAIELSPITSLTKKPSSARWQWGALDDDLIPLCGLLAPQGALKTRLQARG